MHNLLHFAMCIIAKRRRICNFQCHQLLLEIVNHAEWRDVMHANVACGGSKRQSACDNSQIERRGKFVRQWFDLANLLIPLFATWVQSPDLNDVHYGSWIRGPERPTEMYSRICLELRLQAGQSMYGPSDHALPLSRQMIDDCLTNGPTCFLSMFYVMYVA